MYNFKNKIILEDYDYLLPTMQRLIETYNYLVEYGYEKFITDNEHELSNFQDDNWDTINYFALDISKTYGELENFGTIIRTVTIMCWIDANAENQQVLRCSDLINCMRDLNKILTITNI